MELFESGARVIHQSHGEGLVVKKRLGHSVVVNFDRLPGLPLTVKQDELAVIGSESEYDSESLAEAAEAFVEATGAVEDNVEEFSQEVEAAAAPVLPTTPAAPTSAMPPCFDFTAAHDDENLDQADSFQVLESLRLGVVPLHGVSAYTVGRDLELESIRQMLKEGGGCRIIWGDYGAGKTHLLDVTEQAARRAGYATSRIVLDPREHSLAHPLRLYRRIADSIHLPGAATFGLDSVFDSLVDSKNHNSVSGSEFSRFFSSYLYLLRNGDEEEIGWFRDYVHGDRIAADELRSILAKKKWRAAMPLTLSDFRTYGRMYIHLVGTLSSWVKDTGAKGLFLLFDEVERLDALDKSQQIYALEVLKHYAAVTMHEADLTFDVENGLYKGGHSVHRSLPLKFREDQPLSVVFALTPLPEIEEHFENVTSSKDYDIRLRAPARRDMPELVDRIGLLYTKAYPSFNVAPHREDLIAVCDHVLDQGGVDFRAAVRATVLNIDERRLSGTP
ncbi:MAG: hypothetical protein ACI97A_003696 [Planctomycetota bacterium]|jgi:hypothetical protein